MKRLATWAILFLAFCGLADSAYLTQSEMSGVPLQCSIQNLTGCNLVAQSSYSHIFGVSLAEYGLLFYGLLFIVAAVELLLVHRRARRVIQVLAGAGFVMSVYFILLQIFVIQALCIYCLASALIVLLIFGFSFLLEPVERRVRPAAPPAAPLSMPPTA